MSVGKLTAGGILRAGEVVEIAAAVGLPLDRAAVLLAKESAGGRNVWGSDPVATGGAYTKGGPVTEANYRAYRAAQKAGRAGAQGVGPCQLTWRGYQDAADLIGGCWDWRCNVTVGFQTLRDLQREHGVRDGFRRYNGSGRMAERYADDAMARLGRWATLLAPPPAPPPAPYKRLHFGMEGVDLVRRVQQFLRRAFPEYAGDLPDTGNYMDRTASAVKEFQRRAGITGADADGRTVGPRTWAALIRHGFR
ncbi:MAG: peptidoglycan-binding domain-containing protein [Phycicoccus sp.]